MTVSPFLDPGAYDFFTLDGTRHPGTSAIVGDGDRTEEFQDQAAPLTLGANTWFRYEPNGLVTFEIRLWNEEQIQTWPSFVAMLNEGKRRRPLPRVYVIADPRLEDVEILTVSFQKLGSRMIRRGSAMTVRLALKEVRRQKQQGGAAQAPKTEVEKQIEALSAQNRALDQQLAAATKAARAGK